jgi:cyclic pyranopterin monophosphate synthase
LERHLTEFSHLDARGEARMVDVSSKPPTTRVARAEARILLAKATLDAIYAASIAKGDVLSVARVAGIQGAKRTAELIPLCHPLALSKVAVEFERVDDRTLRVESECKVNGPTGVEMEALTAVSVAALTVYDMCKSADRGIRIESIRLVHKSGGKSGTWNADGAGE